MSRDAAMPDEIASVAEDNFRVERQLAEQFSAKLCYRPRLPNHKGTRRANVHDVVVA